MKSLVAILFTLTMSLPAGAATVLAERGAGDVIVLGEVHDNATHHENQATTVAKLKPTALVFEMLTPAQAALITPDNRHDAGALAEALDWDRSGWPEFGFYHAIMTASGAPVYGGALPREDVRRAIEEGAAAVFGEQSPRFGLDNGLPDEEQAAREELQQVAHCNALPPEMLPGMVEAQRLRDAALARASLRAAEETGGPVVVITGNGHARRDWGLPAALTRAAPDLRVWSVAQLEEPVQGTDLPYDRWIATQRAEREDPCGVFEEN